MQFELYEKCKPNEPLMCFNAKNEIVAWKKIKNGGIRNRTHMFSLLRID